MKATALAGGLLIGLAVCAQARQPAPSKSLECSDIRRLSDNFLLDLRIRFIFSRATQSYARLENTGRGWQVVAQRPYLGSSATRITLGDDASFISYVERLTGDYYHIDQTGAGLSVWGHCIPVAATDRVF